MAPILEFVACQAIMVPFNPVLSLFQPSLLIKSNLFACEIVLPASRSKDTSCKADMYLLSDISETPLGRLC
jgi:hypothetical protein